VTSTDCSGGQICGFLESAGCSAAGSCFQAPGVTCEAIALACACDGTNINIACNGLPGGYAPKPYAHAGTCGSDAGVVVTGPTDAGSLADGAACVASNGDPCGAGLSCCPTAGYADAPTACTPTCTGNGCAGACRALP
jgi:hypothetical protein